MKKTLLIATYLFLALVSRGQDCDPPVVTVDGIESEICINDDPYALQFDPPGGQFLIDDKEMTEHIFNPAEAGLGLHTLIYIYQFSADCSPIIFSKSVLVNDLPAIELNADTVINCSKDRLGLAARSSDTGAGISWEFEGSQVASQATFETMMPGLYTAVASTQSCRNFIHVNVIMDTIKPVLNRVDYDVLDCEKGVFQLQADVDVPGGSYAWSRPQGFYSEDAIPEVEALGSYDLMYTHPGNGCTSEGRVEVKAPVSDLDLNFSVPSCPEIPDGQIAVSMVSGDSPPYLYAINGETFVMDSLFTGLSQGEYQVSVQDFYGCAADTAINLAPLESFSVALPEQEMVQFQDNIALLPEISPSGEIIVEYIWTVNDSTTCANCTELNLIAENNLAVTFEAVNDKGCRASAQTSILVDRTPKVFAPNVFSPNGDLRNDEFCLFANPVIRSIAEFRIFDRWGNLLFLQTDLPVDGTACWDGILQGEAVDTGTYIYSLTLDLATGGESQYSGSITVLK